MLLATASMPIAAQTSFSRGDITVHYSAVATTSLAPEIARQYSITRSPARGLLNIVVLRAAADGMPTSIKAKIVATATDADGRKEALTMREVIDAASVSYLAEPRVPDGEALEFELVVTPEGEGAPIEIRFEQTFFSTPAR